MVALFTGGAATALAQKVAPAIARWFARPRSRPPSRETEWAALVEQLQEENRWLRGQQRKLLTEVHEQRKQINGGPHE